MFEREESELAESKKIMKDLSISDDRSDQAILRGIQQAKAEKKKKRVQLPIKTFTAACILGLSFITSVNVSEPVAYYMSNVPGMGKIVDFVRYDKGLLAAVENNYIQKVDSSVNNKGIEFTLNSIIHDEKSLIIFYEYQSDEEDVVITPESFQLLNEKGEVLPYHIVGEYWNDNPDSLLEIRVPLKEGDNLPNELILSTQFSKDKKLLDGVWEIPFTLDKGKIVGKKVYNVDKTLEIEGQQLTIKDVTMYPSQTAVHVYYNSQNSKKIFGINDLHLIDEKGETWNTSVIETTQINENETIIYLQSNYFTNPKELYLRFNSIRALDKEELNVEVDPIKKKILKAPKDGKLTDVEIEQGEMSIKLDTNPNQFKSAIFRHAIGADGNVISKDEPYGISYSYVDDYVLYSVPFPSEATDLGPVKLELLDYPASISAEANVKIK